MSEARIEVSDLVVRYGGVVAVDGVSFTVGQGEHVTLLGPSGCGKTTTLRAIAGLEEPSAGTIRIEGRTMYSAAERRNVPSEKRGVWNSPLCTRHQASRTIGFEGHASRFGNWAGTCQGVDSCRAGS